MKAASARSRSTRRYRLFSLAVATFIAVTTTSCDVGGNEPEVCSPPVAQQALQIILPTLFITVAAAETQRYACSADVVDPCADNSESCVAERDAEEVGASATLDFRFDNQSPVNATILSLSIEDIRCFSPENESQFSILPPWENDGVIGGRAIELVQIQFDRVAPGDCDALFAIESDAANLDPRDGSQIFRIPVRFYGTSED